MLNQLQILEQQGIIRALDYQFAKLIHSLKSRSIADIGRRQCQL